MRRTEDFWGKFSTALDKINIYIFKKNLRELRRFYPCPWDFFLEILSIKILLMLSHNSFWIALLQNTITKLNSKHFFMIQNTGLFRGGLLSHAQVPHTRKNNVKGDKSHMQIKLLTKLFYYLIACVWSRYLTILMLLLHSHNWLLNWSYVNKYFDSESYWFYIEIKKAFLLSPIYHHLKSIFAIGHPTEENQQSVSRVFFFFFFFQNRLV